MINYVNYTIVTARSWEELEQEVYKKLLADWEPVGAPFKEVFSLGAVYLQAMVLRS